MPDESYSIPDIQDYFEYIIKKHETKPYNSPVQIYVNKIKNRIVFKGKTGHKLELLFLEIMKLLESVLESAKKKKKKKDVDQDKNGENTPNLESVEIILVRCNLVKNFKNTVPWICVINDLNGETLE